jgi:hypothetical protein
MAVDDSVRVLRVRMPVGADRRQSVPWPTALAYARYGGPTDVWGTTWTAADFRDSGFGISVAPRFVGTAGNDRAHVDSVRATVYFTLPCR